MSALQNLKWTKVKEFSDKDDKFVIDKSTLLNKNVYRIEADHSSNEALVYFINDISDLKQSIFASIGKNIQFLMDRIKNRALKRKKVIVKPDSVKIRFSMPYYQC